MIVINYKTGDKYTASIIKNGKILIHEINASNYYLNRSIHSIKIRTNKGNHAVLKGGYFYELERFETVTHIKAHKDMSFKLVSV